MRKHGIDLEDTTKDGSRPKRLDRKDLDALMGDGRGGIFTWREKNRRKVSTIPCSIDIVLSIAAYVSWRIPCRYNLRL